MCVSPSSPTQVLSQDHRERRRHSWTTANSPGARAPLRRRHHPGREESHHRRDRPLSEPR